MPTTPEPLAALIQAVAFATDKHRNQRRKDAEASPYINHPIALANVLASEGGVHPGPAALFDGPHARRLRLATKEEIGALPTNRLPVVFIPKLEYH